MTYVDNMTAQKISQPGESVRDKLNLQYNVHRHLDRMSKIINDPQLDENRYNWAIEHLLMMLEPYGDDGFKKEKSSIDDEYNRKIKNAKTTSEEEKLIREKNRMILQQLSHLIKRLRLGLEIQGSEDIGD